MWEAFERLDLGAMKGDDIGVEFPSALVGAARRERYEVRAVERRRERIARMTAAPRLRGGGAVGAANGIYEERWTCAH
jgi:hypothetical protein